MCAARTSAAPRAPLGHIGTLAIYAQSLPRGTGQKRTLNLEVAPDSPGDSRAARVTARVTARVLPGDSPRRQRGCHRDSPSAARRQPAVVSGLSRRQQLLQAVAAAASRSAWRSAVLTG